MKRFAKWLFVQILWPILRELLIELLRKLLAVVFETVRSLLRKWRERDEKHASSEAERDEIRRTYERREQDLDEARGRIFDQVPEIVESALRSSEEKRDRLLRGTSAGGELPNAESPKGGEPSA